MIKKNDVFTCVIEDLGSTGEGIARIDNFVIFIDGALIGEKCKIKILKSKKNYGYGKIIDILEPSENRVIPRCNVYSKCGGCNLQHLNYEGQLKYKEDKLKSCLEKIGGFKNIKIDNIVSSNNYNYRNKSQFPIRKIDDKAQIGFYAKNSHRLIPCIDCSIQNEINKEINNVLLEYLDSNNISCYDEITQKGILRHIVIRVGTKTKEIMVCLVINSSNINVLKNKEKLIENLCKIENLKSIVVNFNTKNTNVILGDRVETLWGKSYIEDYIDNIKFRISPLSFYQVNSIQAEKMYKKVIEIANISKDDVVLDAYCGIGTISLCISKYAKKVYGIEIVEQAIKDAQENARINNIENTDFIVGKSEEVIKEFVRNKDKIDIVVVDPPRKGCDIVMLNNILELNPKKIIYVSCDPATLSRDLKILCEDDNYKLDFIQPFDMFPNTYHVETVCLLNKKA